MNKSEKTPSSTPTHSDASELRCRVTEYQRILKKLKDETITPTEKENLRDHLESEAMSLFLESLLSEEDSPKKQTEIPANERSKESPLRSAPVPDPDGFVSITDEEVLQRIRHHHVHNYDKWRRMMTGAASTLISYQSGVLDLELRIPRPSLSNKEKLIFGVPRSWLNEPELQQAYGYILRVYETHHCDILLEKVTGRFPRGEEQ